MKQVPLWVTVSVAGTIVVGGVTYYLVPMGPTVPPRPTPSATPTPSPSASPTPSPTPSEPPSPSPSPSTTPSPTPTPTATPTPAPTPTATPMPSPSSSPIPGAPIYADGTLGVAKCTTYHVSDRTCGSGSLTAYKDIQSAVDAAKPGTTVLVRGGVYQQPPYPTRDKYVVLGGSGARILSGYPGEWPSINGRLTPAADADGNGDGLADGPANSSGDRTHLIHITGSGWKVQNLQAQNSSYKGLIVPGDDNVVENVIVRDSWLSNCGITGNGNVVNGEFVRSRHQTGCAIASNGNPTVGNRIEESLFYQNGKDGNGQKVLPIPGDTDGGGNSDGMGNSKGCNKDCPFPTATCVATETCDCCPDNVYDGNASIDNSDDGADWSTARKGIHRNNILYANTPVGGNGAKYFASTGNLSVGNVFFKNKNHGVEFRVGYTAQSTGQLYHTTAIGNGVEQISVTVDTAGSAIAWNNLANGPRALIFSPQSKVQAKTNLTVPAQLVNPTFTPDLNFPQGLTVRQKVAWLRAQFVAALSPKAGSPAIDAATLIPGLHCATADDSAAPPAPGDLCRHWRGKAPDIGAFEFGAQP